MGKIVEANAKVIEAVKAALGVSECYRRIHARDDDVHNLKDPAALYRVDCTPEKAGLS